VIDPDGAPEDVLFQVILKKLRAAQKLQAVAVTRMVIAEAHRFPDIAAAQWADHRYLLDPIVEYLQAQNAKGTLRIEDPAIAALQLSMLAGGGFRTLLDKPLTREAQEAWAKSVLHLCLTSWKNGSPQISTSS
jgi:TetR/AcrR family transcriptional repressor of mexJK operon